MSTVNESQSTTDDFAEQPTILMQRAPNPPAPAKEEYVDKQLIESVLGEGAMGVVQKGATTQFATMSPSGPSMVVC